MKTAPLLLPLLALALASCNAGPPPPEAPTPEARAPSPPAPANEPPAAASPGAPAGPVSPEPSVTHSRFDGYGPLRFGMTEAEVRKAWPGELDGIGPAGAEDACHYLNPVSEHAPAWFAFMFEGGKFVRYDVGNPDEVAPGGGKVGMSDDEIRALYPGRVSASPHKYVEGGQYLRVPAGQGDGFVVFETDASGQVTGWRAGLAPQVDYIEGCS